VSSAYALESRTLRTRTAVPNARRTTANAAPTPTPASFLSMIVPLGVFFAFQRYFVQGLLAGSVK
jgi:ABC-type glycerol-3-phosphate transport system permease component